MSEENTRELAAGQASVELAKTEPAVVMGIEEIRGSFWIMTVFGLFVLTLTVFGLVSTAAIWMDSYGSIRDACDEPRRQLEPYIGDAYEAVQVAQAKLRKQIDMSVENAHETETAAMSECVGLKECNQYRYEESSLESISKGVSQLVKLDRHQFDLIEQTHRLRVEVAEKATLCLQDANNRLSWLLFCTALVGVGLMVLMYYCNGKLLRRLETTQGRQTD